ncbi:MAG TPA: hypothetical protein VKA36_06090 [Solirubrobacterales bacterium]|nr:hypothetical protein [Solirubrobacterales bacterium]
MSSAEQQAAPGPDDAEPASGDRIFGNLPRSRPSVRSPRREAARQEDAPDAASEDAEPAPERGREAEVEALARAGISLAGEAASLGFRAAGRAAAALRGAVERR